MKHKNKGFLILGYQDLYDFRIFAESVNFFVEMV